MTHKKIDLSEATEEWAKATLGRYYESAASRYPTDEQRTIFTQRAFLSEKLGLYDIDLLWVEPLHGKITMQTGSSFDAKALNRLMNSEIHHDDKVFAFESMSPNGHMTGDTYCGEYSEYPAHRIEIIFRAEK